MGGVDQWSDGSMEVLEWEEERARGGQAPGRTYEGVGERL